MNNINCIHGTPIDQHCSMCEPSKEKEENNGDTDDERHIKHLVSKNYLLEEKDILATEKISSLQREVERLKEENALLNIIEAGTKLEDRNKEFLRGYSSAIENLKDGWYKNIQFA